MTEGNAGIAPRSDAGVGGSPDYPDGLTGAPSRDVKAGSGIPGRFGCSRCGASWSGLRIEHCTICHQTFSGTATGDMHRVGDHGARRRCRTVEEMLALTDKHGEPRLKLNGRGVWVHAGEHPYAMREDQSR